MNNPLTLAFVSLVFVLSLLDNYTTWVMLHAPVPGWDVVEANPIAAAFFNRFGLEAGLLGDTVITGAACVWGYRTKIATEKTKLLWCSLLSLVSLFAVVNNTIVIIATGVWQ
jgi:hypothetical protein